MASTETATTGKKVEKKSRKVAGHTVSARISFGTDKDGKPYGKANNPKRAGSDSNKMFELYRSNMTIQQAMDAGVSAAHIAWDKDKGFIKIAEAA